MVLITEMKQCAHFLSRDKDISTKRGGGLFTIDKILGGLRRIFGWDLKHSSNHAN